MGPEPSDHDLLKQIAKDTALTRFYVGIIAALAAVSFLAGLYLSQS